MSATGGRAALWPAFLDPADQGRDDLCAVGAKGVRIRYADGRERLCGTSGLWNVNLGYGDETIADAVARALHDASYLGVFRYENSYARQAAEALVDVCNEGVCGGHGGPGGAGHFARVMFSTSGGAANDLTMKLLRQYHALRGRPDRKIVVGLVGSYHGLTFGSIALTGEDFGKQLYGVDTRLVRHVPPDDPAALERLLGALGNSVAGIVVEPVLGTGALSLTDEYVAALLRLRERYGFLLVADEVATGFGRTGTWFASQRWPQPPDVLVTSKGLTNGTCAAAAVVVSQRVAAAFRSDGGIVGHGETQAGTAVTAAAVLATIRRMHDLDAVTAGRRVADRLDRALEALVLDGPRIAGTEIETAGLGCFRALRLAPDGVPLPQEAVPLVVRAVRDAGAVVHPGPGGVQLVPALTYRDEEIDDLVDRLSRGLARAAEQQSQGVAV